jgi:tRNA 2-selenouridine synthase
LDYYDKTYTYDLNRRNVPIYSVDVSGFTASESAALLIERSQQTLTTSACLNSELVTTHSHSSEL